MGVTIGVWPKSECNILN
ncbi:hypothetical protein F383_28311 [Gossypium arboreum]|uniref:Uncharacterized protein n=1 Tax=Gossypium arboreum TaxID=29729 RepID=A0A0B0N8L4_GOSAR|nr:hypothetical protein F383_36019 [Gossypium arboreum]KHG20360.1 hypothetical protein F383_23938 [Gossypium arboreum]KHG20839.1 hypothetical protein F383_28311 [Gossypium arboreum]